MNYGNIFTIAILLLAPLAALHAADEPTKPGVTLTLSLQSRGEDGKTKLARESWPAKETAIIVCDMWDFHHCHNADEARFVASAANP